MISDDHDDDDSTAAIRRSQIAVQGACDIEERGKFQKIRRASDSA
jgi:hypothetical protein